MKRFRKLFLICLTILAAATFSGVMLSCSDDSSDSSPTPGYPAGLVPGDATGDLAGLNNLYSVYSVVTEGEDPIVMSAQGAAMVFYFDGANSEVVGLVLVPAMSADWLFCEDVTETGPYPTVMAGAKYSATTTVLTATTTAPDQMVGMISLIGTTETEATILGDDAVFTTASVVDQTPVVYNMDKITADYFTAGGAMSDNCDMIALILAQMTSK